MGKLSMSMEQAKGSFYINMGEVMEQQARISGRELTQDDRRLFSKELRFPEVVVRVAKFNPDSVSPMELAALRDGERKERVARLTLLVDGAELADTPICDLIDEPEYI